jgi:hypothetical protein
MVFFGLDKCPPLTRRRDLGEAADYHLQDNLSALTNYALLETTKQDLARAQTQLADSRAQINDLSRKLDEIYHFQGFVVPITAEEEKMAYGAMEPRAFDILQTVLGDAERSIRFGHNGPDIGYTSPEYAERVLMKVGLPSLREPRDGPPQNGDIITYAGGYTMFYFNILALHKEFVIGMTPQGILALRPDFGEKTHVYAVLGR